MSTLGAGAFDRVPSVRTGASILLVIAALLVWPLIVVVGGDDPPRTSEATDQARHHEPFLRALAQTWPALVLDDYASATTPGYHYVLALVARVVSDDDRVLRFAGSLFTAALLLVLYLPAARRVGAVDGVLLVLPFACSAYVVSAGAWLVTDNAGWFLALLAVSSVLFAVPRDRGVLTSAWAALGATLVRQVHIWAVVPAALELCGRSPLRCVLPATLRAPPDRRWSARDAAAFGVLFLSPVTVAGFVWWWGGLVPPRYQGLHASSLNPSAITMTLALAGIFGVFFVAWFLRRGTASDETGHLLRTGLMGAVCGLGVWALLPTSYDVTAGRWGALWSVARHVPAPLERSLLFLPLVMFGAGVLVLGIRAAWNGAGPRSTLLLLASFAAWMATQIANAQAWQRYCEPAVLALLCWLAVLAAGGGRGAPDRDAGHGWVRGALLAGAVMQLLITLMTVHRTALAG